MIFLTGASGFVGSHLTKALLGEGYSVRCLLRNPARPGHLEMAGKELEVVQGDITDISSIVNALEGDRIETVIHLVGILTERRGQTFRSIHVEGVRNVVEACRKKVVKRYIHISALGTRGDARSEYHRTKWDAEEIIRGSDLEYTIFRPSVIFGREDRFTNLFAGIMRLSPFLFIPGSGQNRMQPVYVDDLVRAMIKAVREKGHENKVYEIGGPEDLTFDEIIDAIAMTIGKRIMKVHIPIPVMMPLARVAEVVFPQPPITRDQLLMLEEDNTTKNNALTNVFNLTPTGFKDGMSRYLS